MSKLKTFNVTGTAICMVHGTARVRARSVAEAVEKAKKGKYTDLYYHDPATEEGRQWSPISASEVQEDRDA